MVWRVTNEKQISKSARCYGWLSKLQDNVRFSLRAVFFVSRFQQSTTPTNNDAWENTIINIRYSRWRNWAPWESVASLEKELNLLSLRGQFFLLVLCFPRQNCAIWFSNFIYQHVHERSFSSDAQSLSSSFSFDVLCVVLLLYPIVDLSSSLVSFKE